MIEKALGMVKGASTPGVVVAIALACISLISNYSSRSTRLDYVESAVAKKADQKEVDGLKEWMKRVDEKLDRLLEQRQRGR